MSRKPSSPSGWTSPRRCSTSTMTLAIRSKNGRIGRGISMASELPDSKHWTLREPRSLSWKKQRELAIQRAMFRGYVWCPFGHWFKRDQQEPHVHHIVKERHWVDATYSHVLPNLVAFCSQHHLPGVFPWHDERPHFLMRVFATTTGGEFGLLSRHRDQYLSWPRVRLAFLEGMHTDVDAVRCVRSTSNDSCTVAGSRTSITYNLRRYHFANPNNRPSLAHLTNEMVTLCFDCSQLASTFGGIFRLSEGSTRENVRGLRPSKSAELTRDYLVIDIVPISL